MCILIAASWFERFLKLHLNINQTCLLSGIDYGINSQSFGPVISYVCFVRFCSNIRVKAHTKSKITSLQWFCAGTKSLHEKNVIQHGDPYMYWYIHIFIMIFITCKEEGPNYVYKFNIFISRIIIDCIHTTLSQGVFNNEDE